MSFKRIRWNRPNIAVLLVAGEGFEPSKAEPGDLQIWGFAEAGSSLAYIAQFSPHIGGLI